MPRTSPGDHRLMGDIAAEGLRITVPAGWDGRIDGRAAATEGTDVSIAEAERTAVLHAANFPLPPDMGDFGGGVVDIMGPGDVLVVVFEYSADSVGTALFASEGIPTLRPVDMDPMALRKLIPGQSGVQRFFTFDGRAFCVYVVLGAHSRRVRLVPVVNRILSTLRSG